MPKTSKKTNRRKGFTLLEVLIAVAIMGLVVAGGFRLTALSLRTLSETEAERELLESAQVIFLDFSTKDDMPDSGEKNGVKWRVTMDSLPIADGLELKFRKLHVESNAREIILYLPDRS